MNPSQRRLKSCRAAHIAAVAHGRHSLGIIVYNLFSGVLPFRGDTPVTYMSAHLHEKPKPLKTPAGRPSYPRRLEDLVARMLEKDRNRRPGSYDDVVRARARAWGLLSQNQNYRTVGFAGAARLQMP